MEEHLVCEGNSPKTSSKDALKNSDTSRTFVWCIHKNGQIYNLFNIQLASLVFAIVTLWHKRSPLTVLFRVDCEGWIKHKKALLYGVNLNLELNDSKLHAPPVKCWSLTSNSAQYRGVDVLAGIFQYFTSDSDSLYRCVSSRFIQLRKTGVFIESTILPSWVFFYEQTPKKTRSHPYTMHMNRVAHVCYMCAQKGEN